MMKSLINTLLFVSLIFLCGKSKEDANDKLAFPGAMGWAATTIGGKGGNIVKVTNLKKEGKGSLRAALETDGSRIIVFEVGGIIDLEGSAIRIEKPFVTLMGQTAPDPGITIIKGGLSIRTHQVIIQHIRVRPGENNQPKKSGWEIDAISTSSAHHIIIDHCSVSWATDESLSASGPRFNGENPEEWRKNTSHTITFSNNLIAESLSNSTHSKGEHSKGSLIHDNVTDVAIVRNIYASNYDRNPLFKGGTEGVIVNNYIFNPGRAAIDYGLVNGQWRNKEFIPGKISIVGNVMEKGPDTKESLQFWHAMGPVEVYFKNNKVDGEIFFIEQKEEDSFEILEQKPVWPDNLDVISKEQLKEYLLENVGARPWNRDGIDTRIIREVKERINRVIDSENEVGGYPIYEPTYEEFNIEEWDMKNLTHKN